MRPSPPPGTSSSASSKETSTPPSATPATGTGSPSWPAERSPTASTAGSSSACTATAGSSPSLRPLVEPIVQPRLAIWRAGYLAITLAEGDGARAREELAAIATDHFAAVRRDGFWLAAMCMLAETAIALDARDAMAELAAQLEPYGDRCAQIGLALFLGPVSGFEGRLRRALGEHERADALLEDARARCDAVGARTAELHTRQEPALPGD